MERYRVALRADEIEPAVLHDADSFSEAQHGSPATGGVFSAIRKLLSGNSAELLTPDENAVAGAVTPSSVQRRESSDLHPCTPITPVSTWTDTLDFGAPLACR
jgi:hypothetical protein